MRSDVWFVAAPLSRTGLNIHSKSLEIADSLRSRSPEWFGLELIHADVAIIVYSLSVKTCRHFDCKICRQFSCEPIPLPASGHSPCIIRWNLRYFVGTVNNH